MLCYSNIRDVSLLLWILTAGSKSRELGFWGIASWVLLGWLYEGCDDVEGLGLWRMLCQNVFVRCRFEDIYNYVNYF